MTETAELAKRLSEGAANMLLHIARIRPLPEPFPPYIEGQKQLMELIVGDLIEQVSDTVFAPSELGCDVAEILRANLSNQAIVKGD